MYVPVEKSAVRREHGRKASQVHERGFSPRRHHESRVEYERFQLAVAEPEQLTGLQFIRMPGERHLKVLAGLDVPFQGVGYS